MSEDYSFIFESKIMFKTISKLNESFDGNIEVFLQMLTIYSEYLDKIQLLGSVVKISYMNSYIKNDDINSEKIFCNKILYPLNSIIDIYLKFSLEDRKKNIIINYVLIDIIYRTILILYEYYYYISNLKIYYISNPTKTVDDYLRLLNYEITSPLSDPFERLYSNIIKNFYKDILKLSDYKASLPIYYKYSHHLIEKQLDNIRRTNIDEISNIYIKNIILLIIKINDELKLHTSTLTTFITIPQYFGVCWYISILTGMCYSDGSKNLILKKLEEPATLELSIADNKFKDLVQYLITNITNINKKYSTSITDDCEHFKKFKDNQLSYIIEKYKEFYIKNIEVLDGINQDNIDQIIGLDDDYYYYKLYLFKKVNINNELISIDDNIKKNKSTIIKFQTIIDTDTSLKPEDIEELNGDIAIYNTKIEVFNERKKTLIESLSTLIENDKFSNVFFGYLILNTLYKTLNISTLYLLNDIRDEKNYYKQTNNRTANPDIIFINHFDSRIEPYDIYTKDYFKTMSNATKVKKTSIIIDDDDISIIKYNRNIYKLDYLLHRTDGSATCNNCGHCISGIHYKGKEYYYNSEFSQKNIYCGADNISIPCSLIKQEWKPKKRTTEKTHFCLKKCYYDEITYDDNLKIKQNFSEDNVCFNLKSNFIYAYVKINET